MRDRFQISSFYKFFPIRQEDLGVRKLSLETRAARFEVRGLLILAEEGLNGTISGSFESVRFFEQSLPILFGNGEWEFKRASALVQPFRDFRVKIRSEICTTKKVPHLTLAVSEDFPAGTDKRRLTPQEWQHALENEDVYLLDVRNHYETALGIFRGAVDPGISNFSEFREAAKRLEIPKDKKVLMYCTGGIRCEKAMTVMEDLGYSDTYQLQGGILNYLEQYPHREFTGECFVFDGRLAVDQNLEPTKSWKFCPHCGQPGDRLISCELCGERAVICESCSEIAARWTCSRDCRYRLQHHPSRLAANG